MKKEQEEALIRVPIAIIGWIIMDLWAILIGVVAVISFFYALITAKRHKGLAKFSNYFAAYIYSFVRYVTFTTNKRPFPWADFEKPLEKVDMKKKP